MKKRLFWLCIFALALFLILSLGGCKTTVPSESISHSVKNDLNAISKEVKGVSGIITPECRNTVLEGRLNEISLKIQNVSGQVENITLACQTEKNVLSEKILLRNFIIGVLLALTVLLCYFIVKRR